MIVGSRNRIKKKARFVRPFRDAADNTSCISKTTRAAGQMIPSKRRNTMDPDPVIAVIGCGAIAEAFHLPALVRHDRVRGNLVLVDHDAERLVKVSGRFDVKRTSTDLGSVLTEIDGAIVAVPASAHVSVSRILLSAGVHVLCEKPLSESAADASGLLQLSETYSARLGVNHIRRLFSASRLVHDIVRDGLIGEPRRFTYYQGEKFDWPAEGNSYFGRGKRGILADLGSHIIDLASWWIPGPLSLKQYYDDSRGGSEAIADLRFQVGRCDCQVHLSWLSRYKNTYRIEGTEGAIEGHLFNEKSVDVFDSSGRRIQTRSGPRVNVADAMIDGFLAAVTNGVPMPVPADEVLPTIELIEEAYRMRRELRMPWRANASPVARP